MELVTHLKEVCEIVSNCAAAIQKGERESRKDAVCVRHTVAIISPELLALKIYRAIVVSISMETSPQNLAKFKWSLSGQLHIA